MQTFHFVGCSCVIAYASAQLDCYPCADKVSGYQQIYQHIHIYIYTIYSMYQDISKYISIYIYTIYSMYQDISKYISVYIYTIYSMYQDISKHISVAYWPKFTLRSICKTNECL